MSYKYQKDLKFLDFIEQSSSEESKSSEEEINSNKDETENLDISNLSDISDMSDISNISDLSNISDIGYKTQEELNNINESEEYNIDKIDKIDKIKNMKEGAMNFIYKADINNYVDNNRKNLDNYLDETKYEKKNYQEIYEKNYEKYISLDIPKFDNPNYILTEPEYLESLNELPKWNKVMLYEIEKNNLIEYPFLRIDIKEGVIVVYNTKYRELDNFSIEKYIIYYKQPKLSMRQMMEVLLQNLENGDIIINKKQK